jgi:hypothetical protein
MSVLLHSMIALYRFRRADGQLLYIGRTIDLPRRKGEHVQDERYLSVTRIDVEWLPDLPTAIVSEADAIAAECPLWNVQHQIPAPGFRAEPDAFVWAPENEAQRAALTEIDKWAEQVDLLAGVSRGVDYRRAGVRLKAAIVNAWDAGVPPKLLAQRSRPRNRVG